MFTQQYPVCFSYAIDEERALTIELTASVRWQPYSGTYIINEFRGTNAADFAVTLPEIRIRKREDQWVHTDSEAETDLSLALGNAIDDHEESEGSFMAVLDDTLQEFVHFHKADCGNIQLFDPRTGMIQILAHHGFQKPFLDYFKYVSPGDGTVCGNAMLLRRINFMKDLMEDPAYIPHREIIRNAGIRSVVSYPLILADNSFAGVISAHWKTLVDGSSLQDASPLLTELKEFLYENRSETGN